jgi:hypothetical protein
LCCSSADLFYYFWFQDMDSVADAEDYERLLAHLLQIFPRLERSRLEAFARENGDKAAAADSGGEFGRAMEELFRESEAKKAEEEDEEDTSPVYRKFTHRLGGRIFCPGDPVEARGSVLLILLQTTLLQPDPVLTPKVSEFLTT